MRCVYKHLGLVAHGHDERCRPRHAHIRAGRLPQGLAGLFVNRQNFRMLFMVPLEQEHLSAVNQGGAVSIRVVRTPQVDAPDDLARVIERHEVAGPEDGVDVLFIAGRGGGGKARIITGLGQLRALRLAVRDRHIPQTLTRLGLIGDDAARGRVAGCEEEAVAPDSRTAGALEIELLLPLDIRPGSRIPGGRRGR